MTKEAAESGCAPSCGGSFWSFVFSPPTAGSVAGCQGQHGVGGPSILGGPLLRRKRFGLAEGVLAVRELCPAMVHRPKSADPVSGTGLCS
jgi:hypothetical protein